MNEQQPADPKSSTSSAAEGTGTPVSPQRAEGRTTSGPVGGAPRTDAAPAGGKARIPARYAVVMLSCMLVAYVFDQLTKWWVVATMTEGQVTQVLPPLLTWRFIRNPGAAFSIGTDYTWVFTIIMVVVATAIVFQVRKVASWGWAVALGLVLGGALGNLTDRLFREPSFGQGHVVDFIALPNFAIFNIADSAVVSGVVLICLLTLRGVGMDGQRSIDETSEDSRASGGPSDGRSDASPGGVAASDPALPRDTDPDDR